MHSNPKTIEPICTVERMTYAGKSWRIPLLVKVSPPLIWISLHPQEIPVCFPFTEFLLLLFLVEGKVETNVMNDKISVRFQRWRKVQRLMHEMYNTPAQIGYLVQSSREEASPTARQNLEFLPFTGSYISIVIFKVLLLHNWELNWYIDTKICRNNIKFSTHLAYNFPGS